MTGTDVLVIATDGSCLGNPGAGGWAWAVSPQVWGAGGAVHTTNNAMELQAIRQALLLTPTDTPLVIETDSAYSISCLSTWITGWRRNGWRTKTGGAVKNVALIRAVDELLTGREVVFRKVKGHSGNLLNEVCDLRARDAAAAIRSGRDVAVGAAGLGVRATQG